MHDEDLEELKALVEIDLHRKRRKQEMEEGAKDAEQRRRIQWLNALNSSKLYAILAVSPQEAARQIKEVEMIKTLADAVEKGATPLQVLAIEAWSNPMVMDTLAQVMKSPQEAALYDRLIAELERSSHRQEADCQRQIENLMELFRRAMDSVKDVATAFAPASNQRPSSPTACPRCGFDTGASLQSCPNCGAALGGER